MQCQISRPDNALQTDVDNGIHLWNLSRRLDICGIVGIAVLLVEIGCLRDACVGEYEIESSVMLLMNTLECSTESGGRSHVDAVKGSNL
jgi:hypothetical protein